jgi:acyl-homoserine lactone acylase PvdQ
MKSLEQSWMRTKSKSFEDYKKAMDLKANTSNNTVYADRRKYCILARNFIPIREKN